MQDVIKAFGGLRAMARVLGVPVSTVAGWSAKGRAPRWRQPAIDAALAQLAELEDLTPPFPKAG